MSIPKLGADGFYHPTSIGQIADLVAKARTDRRQLRVRGSMHSVRNAILTDGFDSPHDPGPNINIKPDQLYGVRFNTDGTVTAQAGCHLGEDPLDSSPGATLEKSLLYQLNNRGWALGDLGGITHQTVSGFLSTGSSGGSLQYSLADQIARIRLIDGCGKIREFDASRDSDQDMFNAAAVSMGLLGVIYEVDFKPFRPSFSVGGQEAISTLDDCSIDLFGRGGDNRPSLENFLRDTQYTRLMWWPQPGVEKIAVWQAKRIVWRPDRCPYREMGASGIDMSKLPVDVFALAWNVLRSIWKHWREIAELADVYISGLPDNLQDLARQLIADLESGGISKAKELLEDILSDGLQIVIDLYFTLLGNRMQEGLAQEMFREIFNNEEDFENKWSPMIMNQLFLVADKDKPQPDSGKPQTFWDYWYTGLPMDNQIADRLMPTEFTELWIPIEYTQPVMNDLKTFYAKGGYASTGTYACEIYGAKASPFWMSPAYNQDVVRIDVFWFARNADDPATTFFPKFWDLLKKYNFRPHWGKYLPPSNSATGWQYLRNNYPRWNDFMRLRDTLDPDRLFLTRYWRDHLGIDQST